MLVVIVDSCLTINTVFVDDFQMSIETALRAQVLRAEPTDPMVGGLLQVLFQGSRAHEKPFATIAPFIPMSFRGATMLQ